MVRFEDIHVAVQLGIGASGHVYSGTWRGAPVAVKQLGGLGADWGSMGLLRTAQHPVAGAKAAKAASRALELLRRLVREAAILSSLRHPNVVALFGIVVDRSHHALVTELVPGSDMYVLFLR